MLAKHEIYWYLITQVRFIPTQAAKFYYVANHQTVSALEKFWEKIARYNRYISAIFEGRVTRYC